MTFPKELVYKSIYIYLILTEEEIMGMGITWGWKSIFRFLQEYDLDISLL